MHFCRFPGKQQNLGVFQGFSRSNFAFLPFSRSNFGSKPGKTWKTAEFRRFSRFFKVKFCIFAVFQVFQVFPGFPGHLATLHMHVILRTISSFFPHQKILFLSKVMLLSIQQLFMNTMKTKCSETLNSGVQTM